MVSTNGFNCIVLHQFGYVNCAFRAHVGLSSNVSMVNLLRPSLVIGSTKINVIAYGEKDVSLAEPISPPWGSLDDLEESGSGFEPSELGTPESFRRERVMLSVDSVHFLEETDEEILSKRILELSRTNKVRSAMELVGSMDLAGLCPNMHACNSLLSCLLRNDLVDDGMRVFEFMRRKKMTTGHSFSLILKGVAEARGCDTAVKMFAEMEEEIEVKSTFDEVVYNTMISACGRAKDWAGALRFWRSMKENRLCGSRVTYTVLVCTFVRCGQNELAIEAYGEMIRGKFEPGSDTMQAIIGASAKEGKWELALTVFHEMLKRNLKPNQIACNVLINSLGRAGEIKTAFGVFEIMRSSLGHSPDSYTWNAILTALYRANRHDEVLRVFERIKEDRDSQLNLHLYNTALISCSKLGLWDRALQLMWQMECDGITPSTESYNLVVGACETSRKPDVAVQVYEHMVHQNCKPDTFTHLLMIRICIWGSLWNDVEEILNKASPDASIYNAAIQGMCLRGKVDSAKKLYATMRNLDLQPDGKTRALMLQNLKKNSVRFKYRKPSHGRRIRTSISYSRSL